MNCFRNTNIFRNSKFLLNKHPCYSSQSESKSKEYTLLPDVNKALNEQIRFELEAGYAYLAMANYFALHILSLSGCRKFYMKQVNEEQDHALKLIDYVTNRGNCVELKPIRPSPVQMFENPLQTFCLSLEMEKNITQKLEELQKLSDSLCDHFTSNFIKEFLDEQIKSIEEFSRLVAIAGRLGDSGMSIQYFDQLLKKRKIP